MFNAFISFFSLRRMRDLVLAIGFGLILPVLGHAEQVVSTDPNALPNDFVQTVGANALDAIKTNQEIRSGNLNTINEAVNTYVLPYADITKTTRLAAGRYWRTATPQQQQDLVNAFTGTLIRTYSGALSKVDQTTQLSLLPFRGDPKADDVVVRSTLSQRNGPAVGVDYRLEKTPDGWKIYDLNVEGIWLIQNYRNQFSQQISQNGIDGLIQALNQRNQ